jgi:hypothetical protein
VTNVFPHLDEHFSPTFFFAAQNSPTKKKKKKKKKKENCQNADLRERSGVERL